MPFSPLHRQVADVALRVATRHGFVLGGGNALIMHGIIERQTADLDLVSDHEDGVKAAAGAIEEALRAAGFTAEPQNKEGSLGDLFYGFEMGLAEWIVTSPGGEQMILQIAHFDRTQAPVIMNVGQAQELPVLALPDLLASKTAALASRAEIRDILDIGAAIDCGYSPDQLMALAQQTDPGLTRADFADAGQRLDGLSDRAFARYGLRPRDVRALRNRFAGWPRR